MKRSRLIPVTMFTLVVNFAYAVGNCVVGLVWQSWWFIAVGVYYAILSVSRFSVLQVRRRARGDRELEQFAKRITGILFVFLSVSLVGIVILSAMDSRGTKFHEIIMITIAVYAFSKVTFAVIGLVKSKKTRSPVTKTLRDISFAETVVSIFSLQRSMLVTFPGLSVGEIRIFNILTGSGVCLLVLLLGINLIGGRYVEMAKSKIVAANEKLADAVVGGYKKIEHAVVGGYAKVEDKFVEAYLTKEGETVEETKARLKDKK